MSKKSNTLDFIIKADNKHNNFYNYSKVIYFNWKTKVEIICPVHNISFNQTPNNHLNGSGCPVCAQANRSANYKKTIKDKKIYTYEIDEKEIASSQIISINKSKYCIVDKEDLEKLNKYNWNLSGDKYAFNNDVGLMHRFIMDIVDSNTYVDHINHNCLDNRKNNLRVCTPQQNSYNQLNQQGKTSKYKGVFWDKGRNKWQSSIKHNQKRIYIGRFNDEIEAAIAYDIKAIELFGKFANVNIKNKHENTVILKNI